MKVSFTSHALKRMIQRGISPAEVKEVLFTGIVIKEYPEDKPNPSRLILAVINGRPIHVIAAYEKEIDAEIIVTAYEPSEELWDTTFERRKL